MGKILRHREGWNGMFLGFIRVTVLVTGTASLRRGIFKIESFQVLIDLDDIVLIAGFGADKVSRLYIKRPAFRHDLRLTSKYEPVFVTVVIMTVETSVRNEYTKNTGLGHLAPLGAVSAGHCFLAESDNRHDFLLLQRHGES